MTRLKLCVLFVVLSVAACTQYPIIKTWADRTCDVVHALPAAANSELPANSSVMVTASSASITAIESKNSDPAQTHIYTFPNKP